MSATLTPSEIAAVRSAAKMWRVDYPGGNAKATDGHRTLFAAGGPDSFNELWKQALAIRGGAGEIGGVKLAGCTFTEEVRHGK